MDITTSAALIAGLSGISGAAISAYFGNRAQRTNSKILMEVERAKLAAALDQKTRLERVEALRIIHKALCTAPREFSTSKAVAILDAGVPLAEFDAAYFRSAEEIDNAEFMTRLYAPDLTDQLEQIHASMNIYWANLRGCLINKREGISVLQRREPLQNAVDAGMKIDVLARRARNCILP